MVRQWDLKHFLLFLSCCCLWSLRQWPWTDTLGAFKRTETEWDQFEWAPTIEPITSWQNQWLHFFSSSSSCSTLLLFPFFARLPKFMPELKRNSHQPAPEQPELLGDKLCGPRNKLLLVFNPFPRELFGWCRLVLLLAVPWPRSEARWIFFYWISINCDHQWEI